ncbi:MAG TPA: DUF1840 domain-containing protein [Accumulibacter sp.]|uniref:DUF1840 domain-containing protein n=1 Tax=Accumulibacter sp. TaxID=2053492 RepID=UPI000ECD3FC6|nr:DUF1840 domain-containing protein [Accumulibacter sp.]HCZ17385.1 DUF1840 domain-containing protein [Accumulibacter sp.]HRF73980.1 DUF1840 domain-containing protein [Accumulibacter sp.]
MLVKFTSSTSGQIMMFAPVARLLLELVGKECTARGVITTEQLPHAIQELRRAADGATSHGASDAQDPDPDSSDDDNAPDGPPIGLSQRAYPLIELLEWTRKDDGFILWEAAKDF